MVDFVVLKPNELAGRGLVVFCWTDGADFDVAGPAAAPIKLVYLQAQDTNRG